MKIIPIAGALALGLSLCACSSIPGLNGGASSSQLSDALIKIASDPACGHSDELHVILGPVPSGSLDLKRTCGPAAPAAPAAPAK